MTTSINEKKSWLLHQISYSSSLTLHSCPRKLQLEKLRAEEQSSEDGGGSIHFAFGHAVGAGIQAAFLPEATIERCYFAAFMSWDFPLLEIAEKQKKSFWHSLNAITSAWYLAQNLREEGWELAYFEGIPAIEYSFRVKFPRGFQYRAYIDIILFHKESNKYKIVEVKTTGATWLHEAIYANSSQALSYTIVLDYLVKEYSSFDVLYLVYKIKSMEWESLSFTKTRDTKAKWIRNVLIDTKEIEGHMQEDYFPQRGESCFAYFTPCKYFSTCAYSDEYLGLDKEENLDKAIAQEQSKVYDVDIDLNEVLTHQLLTLE